MSHVFFFASACGCLFQSVWVGVAFACRFFRAPGPPLDCPSTGPPKKSPFFPPLPPHFAVFFLSFKVRVWASLGSSCEPPAARVLASLGPKLFWALAPALRATPPSWPPPSHTSQTHIFTPKKTSSNPPQVRMGVSGCPCRDPTVCHRVQGDSAAKRQPLLCGCWCCWSRDVVRALRSCSWSYITLMCN